MSIMPFSFPFRSNRLVVGALVMVCATSCDKKQPLPEPEPAPSVSAKVAAAAGPKVYEHVVLSEIYAVDAVYRSMQGPASLRQITVGNLTERELLWVVGFEAVMVNPKGDERISQEFMCHTNLDVDIEKHQARFNDDKRLTGRLFTISQGQDRIDLPKGYGLPIISDELIDVNTQVLNLNQPEIDRKVRHRVTLRYVRDKELTEPMKALFVGGAFGMKVLEGEDGRYGHDPTDGEDEHPGCLPGDNAGKNTFEDEQGRVFTGHWVVKPGREVNRTPVTDLMEMTFDTTVHYVAVHLHPFAETLELRDLTTGETVYKAGTRQADKGIGLAHVDHFSSPTGFPVFKDHKYEVVSVYNNTSNEDQDSMAVLNLYMLDKDFKKPDLTADPDDKPGQVGPESSQKETPGKMM